jgi:hypothetical protein
MLRQFDYETITDVVIHVRYTALDGGDKLKPIATASVRDFINANAELSRQEGLFAIFDLTHDFSNEWYKAMNPPAESQERKLELKNLNDRLPFFTKGRKPAQILATDVYLVTSAALKVDTLTLTQGQGTDDNSFVFTDGFVAGTPIKAFVINDTDIAMDTWQLKIQDVKTNMDQMWLIVKYMLTK